MDTRKTLSDFPCVDYMQIFNWISRVFYHCIVAEDVTVNRWDVTVRKNSIKKLINDDKIDIKYAFNPKGSNDIGLYILFSENSDAFTTFYKGIFANDRPFFVINFPFFMVSNEKVEDGENEAYQILANVFCQIFEKTMNLNYLNATYIGEYHARLMFERKDTSKYEPVNEALEDMLVLSHAKPYPTISDEERYNKWISHLVYWE